jgi:hypothetical protein
MRKHLKTYCEESSIHGLPYVVNRELHLPEKILWIAALMISFVCCGLLMYEIGLKFMEDKIVTYTSDAGIPVTDVSSFTITIDTELTLGSSKIPFPCVTICPDPTLKKSGVDFNGIVKALTQLDITIDNVTDEEFGIFMKLCTD